MTHSGNYIHYGVREFGMTAIANGVAYTWRFPSLIPPPSAMFMEYARMCQCAWLHSCEQRQVLVYTHDSIGAWERRSTHQPVEQIASLAIGSRG